MKTPESDVDALTREIDDLKTILRELQTVIDDAEESHKSMLEVSLVLQQKLDG